MTIPYSHYGQTPEMVAYWRSKDMGYWQSHHMLYLGLWLRWHTHWPQSPSAALHSADLCIGLMVLEDAARQEALCDCLEHPDFPERCSPIRGNFNCAGKYTMPRLPAGMICRLEAGSE